MSSTDNDDLERKERIKAYNRAYYRANKKKELERNRDWRGRNPESAKAIRDRFYENHKEELKERTLKRYHTDPAYRESVLRGLNQRRTERRAYLDTLLSKNGCSACGEKDFRCLQFHHRDRGSKSCAVTNLISASLRRCQEEIDKCDILCGNCHAKADARIAAEIPRGRKSRSIAAAQAFLSRVKELSGCSTCGERDVVCLQFHHKDADFKGANVGATVTRGIEEIVAELLKCCVLCVNCHVKLHAHERRQSPLAKKRKRQ